MFLYTHFTPATLSNLATRFAFINVASFMKKQLHGNIIHPGPLQNHDHVCSLVAQECNFTGDGCFWKIENVLSSSLIVAWEHKMTLNPERPDAGLLRWSTSRYERTLNCENVNSAVEVVHQKCFLKTCSSAINQLMLLNSEDASLQPFLLQIILSWITNLLLPLQYVVVVRVYLASVI